MVRVPQLFLLATLATLPAGSAVCQPFFTHITSGPFQVDRGNSSGAAWADYDDDDDLDLFVVNRGNSQDFLYANDGQGNLDRVLEGPIATNAAPSSGVCWADYDNNGFLDVFIAGSANASTLYRNEGGGDLQPVDNLETFGRTDLRGWACAWGDIDNDSYVDLVITHPAGFAGSPQTSNHFFRNNGDGTFGSIDGGPVTTGLAPYTVATFSDYDLDGDIDLFIGAGPASQNPGPDFLYRNLLVETGSADFERITTGPLASIDRDGQVINWIDYDNDRDLDVYVTNWGGGAGVNGMRDELFRNDNGELVPAEAGAIVTDKQVSLANIWADFDNDGDQDAYVTDGRGGRASRYYENLGDGTFSRSTVGPAVSNLSVAWGASAGDYDSDGDLDLFVSNVGTGTVTNTVNYLYRNDLENGNHWLRIKLEGTDSNRAGIGAKLHAKSTIGEVPTWQFREVSSQNSFNGHNSLFQHFGLGDAARIDSLIIEWPSGIVDVHEEIDADQFIQLREGQALAVAAIGDQVPSIGDLLLELNYPNPFHNSTNVVFELDEPSMARLQVFDQLGRVVATPFHRTIPAGRHVHEIDLSHLSAGSYLYRLQTPQRIVVGVMTKQ